MPAILAADVAAEIGRWLGYLAAERRMSDKTLDAYRRDVSAVSRISRRTISAARRALERTRRAVAARCARLHGGARAARHRQPLADARTRRRALVRALSGTQRQGQGRRARRRARAENRPQTLPKPLAIAAAKQIIRCRPARRRGARAVGPGPRRRRAGFALRLGPAHFRSAGPQAQGRSGAGQRRRASSSPAKATSSAWCRCCRRCSS